MITDTKELKEKQFEKFEIFFTPQLNKHYNSPHDL